MANKQLDIQACKVFVCPNLSLIDVKGKELGLSDEAIQKSKKVLTEFLKKTYHHPPFASVKSLFPAVLYIGSNLNNEIRTQEECAMMCGNAEVTCRRWIHEICFVVKISQNCDDFGCRFGDKFCKKYSPESEWCQFAVWEK